MPLPTAIEVKDFLQGYGITSDVITDRWIDNRISNFIVPKIKEITRQNFDGIVQVTEPYNGNGTNLIVLNRRPIVSLVSIRYVNSTGYVSTNYIEVLQNQGMLRAKGNVNLDNTVPYFPRGNKNILVTYTYGYADYPADIKEAIIYLVSEKILSQIANRTGGGSIGAQGFNRNFGERGKYDNARTEFSRDALSIIKRYCTGVIG